MDSTNLFSNLSNSNNGELFSSSVSNSTTLFQSQLFANSKAQSTNQSPRIINVSTTKTDHSSFRYPDTRYPAVKLSHLPNHICKKSILYRHFSQFGSIQTVMCQNSTAFIVFHSKASAVRANRLANQSQSSVLPSGLPTGVLASLVHCKAKHSAPSPSLTQPSSIPVNDRLSILQAKYKSEQDAANRLHVKAKSQSTFYTLQQHDDLIGDAIDFAIYGTCSDMCPELERYARFAHNRVSMFECDAVVVGDGGPINNPAASYNHRRAIKDYHRSSADQPVPLARELRPDHVLDRTMNYMLDCIIDLPEKVERSLWKPWYEFVWTRTRAIRKDIIQQRLCNPLVVGVVEKIARFHVFCAARLVDLPVDNFDPRINSENLTQCLQTLKEMYCDLRLAGGNIGSANEAEFRAYMLLMKLNDQSALNEVQSLPVHILQSRPVRFAVRLHGTVTTNNYIRFFRLVLRQANFLEACLLHRYFGQLRSQALCRMSASFAGHPRKGVPFPVKTLQLQLGFEDESETRAFCESWGLASTDEHVIFDKSSPPQPPETAWRDRRSIKLIEAKRSGLALSTVLNANRPVDLVELPPVHSSFDSSGRFVGLDSCLDETDQSASSQCNLSIEEEEEGVGHDVFSPSSHNLQHDIDLETGYQVHGNMRDQLLTVDQQVDADQLDSNYDEGKELEVVVNNMAEQLIDSVVDELIQFVIEDTLVEEKTIESVYRELVGEIITETIIKVDRDSKLIDAVCTDQTWQPFSADMFSTPLAVIVPESDEFTRDVFPWLSVKLSNLPFELITSLPEKDEARRYACLIWLGYTDERCSIVVGSSRFAYPTDSSLIIISPSSITADNDQDDDIYLISLPSTSGRYQPQPFWSQLLTSALSWTHSRTRSCQSPQATPPPVVVPVQSWASVIGRYLDAGFNKPLNKLGEILATKRLVDPAPELVFNLYNSRLKELMTLVDSDPLALNEIESYLIVSPACLSNLTLFTQSHPTETSVPTWGDVNSHWSAFLVSCNNCSVAKSTSLLDESYSKLTRVLVGLLPRPSSSAPVAEPLSLLAPWVKLCSIVVNRLAFNLYDSQFGRSLIDAKLADRIVAAADCLTANQSDCYRQFIQLAIHNVSYSDAIAMNARVIVTKQAKQWIERSDSNASNVTLQQKIEELKRKVEKVETIVLTKK